MKKLLLIWHASGESIYEGRFDSLSKYFELEVFGFNKFQGDRFKNSFRKNKKYKIKLFNPLFSFHWLTVFSLKLIHSIRKSHYDFVYIHEEPHALLSFLILLFRNKKSLYILDAAIINTKLNFNGFNFFEKYVYKNINFIFYRNHEVKKILLKRGAPINKLKLKIGNGVSNYNYVKRNKINTIGFAGKITYRKGLHVIIEALKYTSNKFKLIVCGEILDKEYFKKLNKNFHYYGFLRNQKDIENFYHSCDIFICPSLSTKNWQEQFGRVLIEASTTGALIIGSSSGFIPNLTGECTFEEGNAKNLLKVIDKYSSDMNIFHDTANFQRKNILKKYSWDSIASQVFIFLNPINTRN